MDRLCRWGITAAIAAAMGMGGAGPVAACCAVAASGAHVVNADQTVILLWDQARRTQHFIRQADFRTDAADVGFLVPSPSRPTLAESGNEAFTQLHAITAPKARGGGFPIGCSVADPPPQSLRNVRVIEVKRVAGYDATVLTARSGEALAAWLKSHGYPYSPQVADWARPYLGGTWYFTALKLAKPDFSPTGDPLKAAALRISFLTDRPLFPYREPESRTAAGALDVPDRLLRIFFIAETSYQGSIAGGTRWSGDAVWSGEITQHRKDLLAALKLPANTGPDRWWLTEFHDRWPYARAAGDLYFAPSPDTSPLHRHNAAIHRPGDALFIAILLFTGARPVWKRIGGRGKTPDQE